MIGHAIKFNQLKPDRNYAPARTKLELLSIFLNGIDKPNALSIRLIVVSLSLTHGLVQSEACRCQAAYHGISAARNCHLVVFYNLPAISGSEVCPAYMKDSQDRRCH